MNFIKFKEIIQDLPYFETKELKVIMGDKFNATMLINLKNWVNKGYLMMFRRGLYALSDLKDDIDAMMFATKIYTPSYISMETALNYYGIIPEAVFTTTSVTTRKTKNFKTPVGNFTYQKIKKSSFGGYETKVVNSISYKMALPEKALIDFFYLNKNILDGSHEQFKSYRFSEDFKFSTKKLLKFAKIFRNEKVLILTNNFIKYYATK